MLPFKRSKILRTEFFINILQEFHMPAYLILCHISDLARAQGKYAGGRGCGKVSPENCHRILIGQSVPKVLRYIYLHKKLMWSLRLRHSCNIPHREPQWPKGNMVNRSWLSCQNTLGTYTARTSHQRAAQCQTLSTACIVPDTQYTGQKEFDFSGFRQLFTVYLTSWM